MIRERLVEYFKENLQYKTISYKRRGDGTYDVDMMDGERRLSKSPEAIAREIMDIIAKSLKE